MTPIHAYYHIYADGAWEPVVDEFLRAFRRSVACKDNHLRVGIVGTTENRHKVRELLQMQDVPFIVVAEAELGWEQVTLDQVHHHALIHVDSGQEAYILYAHTKCSAFPQGALGENWRREMTWWNVVRADLAVAALDDGANVAGVHWMQGLEGQPHYFGGNFWWAKASTIATLPAPGRSSRYEAEVWLGQAQAILPEFRFCVLHDGFIGTPAPEDF